MNGIIQSQVQEYTKKMKQMNGKMFLSMKYILMQVSENETCLQIPKKLNYTI
jgi:hypothetical protein